jgi:hypothetical protein
LGLSKPAPASDIRLWLLGSAFGAILHQRGLIALHVSAVKAPTGVWAFTGESGEGKSTLAGFLRRRKGYQLVSDDVAVLDPKDAESIIYPGPMKLKLWADALGYLGFNENQAVRDLSNTEKFQVYLSKEARSREEKDALNGAEVLHALVVLDTVPNHIEPTIERLRGGAAFTAICRAIYRPHMPGLFRKPEQFTKEFSILSQGIEVYRFRRPRSLPDFESNLSPLMRLMLGEEC